MGKFPARRYARSLRERRIQKFDDVCFISLLSRDDFHFVLRVEERVEINREINETLRVVSRIYLPIFSFVSSTKFDV